jgi:hypothetical protein
VERRLVIFVGAIAIAIILLKTALLESARAGGVFPDPVLALAVYAGFATDPRRALARGALAGGLVALLSPDAWSLWPALYGGAAWLASSARWQFLRANALLEIAFLLPLAFAVNGVALFAEYGFGARWLRALAYAALPNAVATAVVAPLVVAIANSLLPRRAGGWLHRAAR